MSKRILILAGVALAGSLAAGAATAHDDVQWSVTIGSPVYSQPVPVYRAPPVVVVPAPVYRSAPHPVYRERTRWDADGDGIPNRYDRVYNPRWDHDGDGVPNWRDRHGHGPREHGGWR